MNSQCQDTFAEIAARGIHFGHTNLIQPEPPRLEEKYLVLEGIDEKAIFLPLKKMNTKEELHSELENQRNHYKMYLQDLAPSMKSYRIKQYLEQFDWRIQTEEDRQNFLGVLEGEGQWEQLKIPHYGAPVGKAVTYYRTQFHLSKEQMNKGSLFVCFKGVDYKAYVFINGSFIGSHEGLFAPFEFDFSLYAKEGKNSLVVMVENDFICMGNATPSSNGVQYTGEKIYAATGPGYDDAEFGWHHCPPGMGIYQDVYVEARPRVFVKDIFVRPLIEEGKAEAWIEIFNCDVVPKEMELELSLYGQNFRETLFTSMRYKPTSHLTVGVGDSLTEAKVKAEGQLNQVISLSIEKGTNQLKVPFDIPHMRMWTPKTPWLYQLQVKLIDNKENILDCSNQQFGMRSFSMDEKSEPKGMFYLNNRKIRLRGANTMGHEQQCVMKKDWDQLIDDILLAKICNMNFLRLTQRPVQPEVYEFCDKLGMMTQTDLPLFGMLRRSQFCEAIRQAEEMERLVRSHPCNVIVTYINEPFPNAGNKPHLNLTRYELEDFFKTANLAIHLNNPDRVIKSIDGDYDPPTGGLPDNHCYPGWYNGHGIDIGRLHKGYWMLVKPGWHYGCGEFGSEGLDPVEVMRKYYPEHWLPNNKEQEKNWSPNGIVGAQTGKFSYMFYDTPDSLEGWVEASHEHQRWATSFMTEAFRRDNRMNTFAIHLFIDAFPSGWMKTIMDVDRQPKPAYFAYRDALTPLMVNIRTDRYKFFVGEDIELETWVCNDEEVVIQDLMLSYQVKMGDEVLFAGREEANIPTCSSQFQGFIRMKAPTICKRTKLTVQVGLIDQQGQVLHDYSIQIEVFPKPCKNFSTKASIIGSGEEKASGLAKDLGIMAIHLEEVKEKDVILIDDYEAYQEKEEVILRKVGQGTTAIFLELSEGEYKIGGNDVRVKSCGMLPLHFVSRNTGHCLVEEFEKNDLRLWYDSQVGYMTPLLETTFTGDQFTPILTSGNIDYQGKWDKALAVAERIYGEGKIVICQVKLAGRTLDNPTADLFSRKLISFK